MFVRICSDIHAEFMNYNKIPTILSKILPPDNRDKDSVLVLAGDIGLFNKYPSTIKPVLKELSPRFKNIIYVYGNHEFYDGVWWEDYTHFWKDKTPPDNCKALDNNYFIVNNTVFIGSTLWTSMNNRDPVTMYHAERSMSDFEVIRINGNPKSPYSTPSSRLVAEDTVDRHEKSKEFIFQAIRKFRELGMSIVVVTHHLPSFLSVNKKYAGDMLNHAFASDMNERILASPPDLWVHGHTHDSVDYTIEGVRVVCNPYGYHARHLNLKYNPNLFIRVPEE